MHREGNSLQGAGQMAHPHGYSLSVAGLTGTPLYIIVTVCSLMMPLYLPGTPVSSILTRFRTVWGDLAARQDRCYNTKRVAVALMLREPESPP